ncbi:uncharacterized protein EI97DRAFT_175751 [Westerdykella ornata]|uniref:Uncharacterized protein n=1 Tax=Westerdykella ornata TaxID=318751 RepID=A0A6A6JWH6_WESOR|nr:uncharacterized protein EI97DRAFT_175751 [Westerdykella ornata]KAF2279419.1 hypothetical protein EI97DRAFT_175751 [Westerdykella ornata]
MDICHARTNRPNHAINPSRNPEMKSTIWISKPLKHYEAKRIPSYHFHITHLSASALPLFLKSSPKPSLFPLAPHIKPIYPNPSTQTHLPKPIYPNPSLIKENHTPPKRKEGLITPIQPGNSTRHISWISKRYIKGPEARSRVVERCLRQGNNRSVPYVQQKRMLSKSSTRQHNAKNPLVDCCSIRTKGMQRRCNRW